MPNFLKDNGKPGLEWCAHTATGYQCVAKHPGNDVGFNQRIMFFARHVVGTDGRPYTEIGFSGLYEEEKASALIEVKEVFKKAGYSEVKNVVGSKEGEKVFSDHLMHSHDSVAIRINAKAGEIVDIINISKKFLTDSSFTFVREQEKVQDVLFQSILTVMGPELSKGPGGEVAALKKAQLLADQFKNGIKLN